MIVFERDKYNQYFISVLSANNYVFNLKYHPKVADMLTFFQEKVTTCITAEIVGWSERKPKKKSTYKEGS